jgi:antitoxin component YwqK of YwqJK toxin-antitoxin module
MGNPDRFAANITLWSRVHPKESVMLPYIEDKGLQLCRTKLDEPNCYRESQGRRIYLHSQEGASKEANEWFASLNLGKVEVLYVFGLGLGYYYDALLPWLRSNKDHTAVFIEDDLALLKEFFQTERAEQMLEDSQVHVIHVSDGDPKNDAIDEIYWNFAMTKATVSALKSYQENKNEVYQALCHEISYSADLKRALLDEYLGYGAPYFANCYRNLLRLPDSYLGDHLFGQFKGIPAIICGAGPSLEKNGPLLKQLGTRALIFAGGSSINILNAMSIQPHFCVGIDPNDAQQVRLRSNQAFEVPFFYRQRLNYHAFRTVHAPHLYITGSGGYDIAEYIEKKLDIVGKNFEEGHNVVNFAMEIAYQMGCYPLIFVGMDLAFTDRKTYSSGVTFDPSVEQRTLDEYASFETVGLKRQDIFGQPIYTLWKWVAESEWIGAWGKIHSDSLLINCTEGGLGFPEVENRPLGEAIAEYLGKERDLQGLIHSEIQSSRQPQITTEKVAALMQELRDSLKRCCSDFEVLSTDLERIKKKTAEEQKPFPHAQSGQAALVELELAEEPAWTAILEIFHIVWARLQNKDLVEINRGKSYPEEWQKSIKRMELSQRRLQFLKDVATANIELIDYARTEREHEQEEESKNLEAPLEQMELIQIENKALTDIAWKNNDTMKQGPWRLYYDSGALKSEANFEAGKLHGPSKFFAEGGTLLASSNFDRGIEKGEAFFYYPSGALYSRLHYIAGLLEGIQHYYYETGEPRTILEYRAGKLVGEAFLYEPIGKLKRHIAFR